MKFPVPLNKKTAKTAGAVGAVLGLSAIAGAIAGPMAERIPVIGDNIAAYRARGGMTRKLVDGGAAAAAAFAAIAAIGKAAKAGAATRAAPYVLGGAAAGAALAMWQPSVQSTLVGAVNAFLPARSAAPIVPQMRASTAPRIARLPPLQRVPGGPSVPPHDVDLAAGPSVSVRGLAG